MFQIPLGPWPFPEGTTLWSRSRPEWGPGIVESQLGRFSVVWKGGGYRLRWVLRNPSDLDELDLTKDPP